jgi:hypothetical protein
LMRHKKLNPQVAKRPFQLNVFPFWGLRVGFRDWESGLGV